MLSAVHRYAIFQRPGITAVRWLPVLFPQEVQAVPRRFAIFFLALEASGQRVAKYHASAVDQIAAGGVIDAAVVVQVMEKSTVRIECSRVEEGNVAPHPVAQEFGISVIDRCVV